MSQDLKDSIKFGALVAVSVFIAIALAMMVFGGSKTLAPKVGGYFFNTPTSATSSVGIYTQTSVLAADTGRSFASFCNNSITSNDAVFLQLGSTSTIPSGIRLASGQCYTMVSENGNLFPGTIYAQASTATTTLLVVSQNKSN